MSRQRLFAVLVAMISSACGGTPTDAPRVVSSVPADGAHEVGLSAPIVVTFDRPMELLRVQAAFDIEPFATGTFTWSEDGTTMSFSPSPPLASTTTYRASISTVAASAAGVRLASTFAITFTTYDDRRFVGPDAEPVIDHVPPVGIPEPPMDQLVAVDGIPFATRDLVVVFAASTTVSEANAIVEELDCAIAGGRPETGMVLLRRRAATDLTTLEGLVDDLAARPSVAAVAMNPFITTLRLPPHETTTDWVWGATPAGGNWWLEAVRMPQAWNLVDYARRHTSEAPRIGVVDSDSANATHEDLFARVDLAPGAVAADHATSVASVIGASWSNGLGIEGAHPLDPIIVSRGGHDAGNHEAGFSWATALDNVFVILGDPRVRVVNMSLGLTQKDIDPITERSCTLCLRTWRQVMDEKGDVLLQATRNFERKRKDFLVVCAAGNVQVRSNGAEAEARDTSACTNIVQRAAEGDATLPNGGLGAEHFIAVEATSVGGSRATFSTSKGTVSAPGAAVLIAKKEGYDSLSGTSYASPLVAGLAAWLWTLDPDASVADIRRILVDPANTVAVPANPAGSSTVAGARGVDAFLATLSLDDRYEDHRFHRALVDVDDGSADGNRRMAWSTISGKLEENTDLLPDGMRGDGKVSMADFRAFRDALVALEASALDESLDGDERNRKRDLNQDGCVGPLPTLIGNVCALPTNEAVHTRFDWNGDGSTDARDLDELVKVWPVGQKELTEGWDASQLAALLPDATGLSDDGSGDITFVRDDLAYDEVRITIDQGSLVERAITSGGEIVWTLPVKRTFAVTAEGWHDGAKVDALCLGDDGTLTQVGPLKHGEDQRIHVRRCPVGPDMHIVGATNSNSQDSDGVFTEYADYNECVPASSCGEVSKRCDDLQVLQTCELEGSFSQVYGASSAHVLIERPGVMTWRLSGSVGAVATVPPLVPPAGATCTDEFKWCYGQTDVSAYAHGAFTVSVPITTKRYRATMTCVGSGDGEARVSGEERGNTMASSYAGTLVACANASIEAPWTFGEPMVETYEDGPKTLELRMDWWWEANAKAAKRVNGPSVGRPDFEFEDDLSVNIQEITLTIEELP